MSTPYKHSRRVVEIGHVGPAASDEAVLIGMVEAAGGRAATSATTP